MLAEKLFDARQEFLVRILEDVVAAVGNSQCFRLGKSLLKLVEKLRRETPVTLAPDKHHRVLFELL